MNKFTIGLFMCGFGMGLICGCHLITYFVTKWPLDNPIVQKAAVDAGKAEYYLDEHHERRWRWKP